jgi:hypothetical protein
MLLPLVEVERGGKKAHKKSKLKLKRNKLNFFSCFSWENLVDSKFAGISLHTRTLFLYKNISALVVVDIFEMKKLKLNFSPSSAAIGVYVLESCRFVVSK